MFKCLSIFRVQPYENLRYFVALCKMLRYRRKSALQMPKIKGAWGVWPIWAMPVFRLLFNRHNVARAVLQTPPLFIHSLIRSLTLFLPDQKILHYVHHSLCVMCHVSQVTCHVSSVTCHLSHKKQNGIKW
jgi:hypothetical protein